MYHSLIHPSESGQPLGACQFSRYLEVLLTIHVVIMQRPRDCFAASIAIVCKTIPPQWLREMIFNVRVNCGQIL